MSISAPLPSAPHYRLQAVPAATNTPAATAAVTIVLPDSLHRSSPHPCKRVASPANEIDRPTIFTPTRGDAQQLCGFLMRFPAREILWRRDAQRTADLRVGLLIRPGSTQSWTEVPQNIAGRSRPRNVEQTKINLCEVISISSSRTAKPPTTNSRSGLPGSLRLTKRAVIAARVLRHARRQRRAVTSSGETVLNCPQSHSGERSTVLPVTTLATIFANRAIPT